MVDLVIAYVNNQDKVWKDTYIKYCLDHRMQNKIVNMVGERYNGINLVEYQLKLIKKNMPFVRKIFLLLSNIEQKPKYDNDNVEIVLHKDFIPYRFLPTFNSTTIEMFLWNIKGLGEKFIYANDDMLPIRELHEEDFFNEDTIRVNWIDEIFKPNTSEFKYQCNNSWCTCRKVLGRKPVNFFLRPEHTMTPMIKSHAEECYRNIERYVTPYISAFRTEYNHNQYIFPIWECLRYGTDISNLVLCYTELNKEYSFDCDILCVNMERNKEIVKKFIKEISELCE